MLILLIPRLLLAAAPAVAPAPTPAPAAVPPPAATPAPPAPAPSPACGGPIDLDTALGLAVTRSDEVAIKQAEVVTAEADRSIARALRWIPIANANVFTGPSPEAHGDPAYKYFSNGTLNPGWPLAYPAQNNQADPWTWERISSIRPFVHVDATIVQPIYTWGRIDAANDAAEAGVRARRSLVDDTVSQVQQRIQQLYWGISLARRFLAISDDVTNALNDAAKRVKKALDEGDEDVSPSDQYKIDVFRGTVVSRTADAQKGLELAQMGLAATLGLDRAKLQVKEVALDATEGELPDPAKVLEAAVRQRPDLHALDDAIAARNADITAQRGAMLPQFYAALNVYWAWAPNRDDPRNPWVSDPLDTQSWPIPAIVFGFRQDLNFPTLSANVKKAEAEKATLERQRAGLARLVQVQVDTALSELKAARTRFIAARSSFNAARALYRSAGLDFAAGLIETNPLIDAYRQYVENQITSAQATYDLIMARAQLARVMGEQPRKGITCE